MAETKDTIYAIMFEDDTKKIFIRNTAKKDHLAYLKDNADRIMVSGDLRNGDSSKGTVFGGLWLVKAPNRTAAQRLIEKDPYYQKGLRTQVIIYRWDAEDEGMLGKLSAPPHS